jgi:hypothetical protein
LACRDEACLFLQVSQSEQEAASATAAVSSIENETLGRVGLRVIGKPSIPAIAMMMFHAPREHRVSESVCWSLVGDLVLLALPSNWRS